jgi:hypothetical protein
MIPAGTRVASTLALPLLLAAALAAAPAEVVVRPGRVEVSSSGTPLAEVLQKLGTATGMKVVIEGPAPRQPLRAHVVATTPAEAVLALLEGQALSYALLYDATGTRIETLLIAEPSAAGTPRTAAAATPAPRGRPRLARPSQEMDDDEEPDPDLEEPAEPPVEVPEETSEAPEATPVAPGSPAAPASPLGPMPGPNFPRSPFTPGPEAAPLFPAPPGAAPPSTQPAAPSPTPDSR